MFSYKKWSLKFKIAIPITTAIIVIFAIFSLVNYHNLEKSINSNAIKILLETSAYNASKVATEIDGVAATIDTLANATINTKRAGKQSRQIIYDMLYKELSAYEELESMWISAVPGADGFDEEFKAEFEKQGHHHLADYQGRFAIWIGREKGKIVPRVTNDWDNMMQREFISTPFNTKESFLSAPFINEGRAIFTIAFPIIHNDKVIAIIGADVAGKTINDIIQSIRPYDKTTTMLLDNDMIFVSHYNSERIGKRAYQHLTEKFHFAKTSEEAKAERYIIDGFFYQAFPLIFGDLNEPWYLIVKVPYDVIFAELKTASYTSITITLIAIFVILFVTILLTTLLTKRLNNDIVQLKEYSDKVADMSEALSDTSRGLSSATTEQAAAVEETTASLEEIAGMVKNNVANAEQANELAASVKNATKESASSMKELIEAMTAIKQSNIEIEKIVKIIETIADKTAIMDDIVFQTKLLSFNASVEAERAGEHGRGFAVVAQEVGNLAAMTGNSAKEIAEIVRNSIDQAKIVTEANNEKVNNGDEHAKTVAEQFDKILSDVELVSAKLNQVVNASKEQSTGVEQINIAMTQVDQANQMNSAKAEETASSSAELGDDGRAIADIVDDINKIVIGE